jgi:hypothetical protein
MVSIVCPSRRWEFGRKTSLRSLSKSIFYQFDTIPMAMATKKIPQISDTPVDNAPFKNLPVALPAYKI